MNLTNGRRYEVYFHRATPGMDGEPLFFTTGFRLRWLHVFWWHGEGYRGQRIWVFWRYHRRYPREVKGKHHG